MPDKDNESSPTFKPRTGLVSQIEVNTALNIQGLKEELGDKLGFEHPFFEAYDLFLRQRSLNEEMLQVFEESRNNENLYVQSRSKTLKAWHALKSYCSPNLRRRKVEKTRIHFNEAARNVMIIEHMCRGRAAGLELEEIQRAAFGRIMGIEVDDIDNATLKKYEPTEMMIYVSSLIKKTGAYESKKR